MSLTANVVAFYNLDESSGNATDATGNGNTLTNTGTVTYEAGKINNGARNDGGSRRLSANINGLTSASNNTWAFWYKPVANTGYIVDHWPTTNNIRCIIYDDGNGIRMFANGNEVDGGAMSTGTFYHVIVTKTGTTWELFVNNVSQGTTTTGGLSYTNNSNFSLLNPADGFGASANAVIDMVGFWNEALDSTDRSTLYNAGAGVQWPFGGGATLTPLLSLMGVGS